MPTPTTPLSRTHAAALSRVLDSIPRGYSRYTCGVVAKEKVQRLVEKFHHTHQVGASPAQRVMRKQRGQANAVLALYLPEWADKAHWVMLFTDGELGAHEKLYSIFDKPRMAWQGYELTRHSYQGGTRWTWRRTRSEMEEFYVMLDHHVKRRRWDAVGELLERAARQPGFHGVREQTWRLCQEACKHGYLGEQPFLYYMTKVSHGERIAVA